MATSPVMRWLADGVPLTLLCDLVAARAPESQTINLSERPLRDRLDPLVAVATSAPESSLRRVSAG